MHRQFPSVHNKRNTVTNVVKIRFYAYFHKPATQCIVLKRTAEIFSYCGFWRSLTDAMTPCVEEAALNFRRQYASSSLRFKKNSIQ